MIEWRYLDVVQRPYGERLAPDSGRIKVPEGPGLGVDPDPEFISAYLIR